MNSSWIRLKLSEKPLSTVLHLVVVLLPYWDIGLFWVLKTQKSKEKVFSLPLWTALLTRKESTLNLLIFSPVSNAGQYWKNSDYCENVATRKRRNELQHTRIEPKQPHSYGATSTWASYTSKTFQHIFGNQLPVCENQKETPVSSFSFTSSLNFRISSVSLWWVLMTSALPLATREALSMRSGLRVPWARNTSSGFRFISPITSLAICKMYRRKREGFWSTFQLSKV